MVKSLLGIAEERPERCAKDLNGHPFQGAHPGIAEECSCDGREHEV